MNMAKKQTDEVEAAVPPEQESPKTKQISMDAATAAAIRLYTAYGATLGYRTVKGEHLEPWENLVKAEQDAWINGAFALLSTAG